MNSHENSELVAYKLTRAKNTLKEAELLIDNKMWNAAVNRIYYACFYAVSGLLISKDIMAKKHSGVIQMFGLHFINTGIINKETGKFYSIVFDMRQSGDYNDYFNFEEAEVTCLFEPAKSFILEIEQAIVII